MIFSRANIGTFFISVTIQGCGVVTGILTARLLGPAARGQLATVLLWPVILSNLGLMGCNWTLAREVANDPAGESRHLGGAVAVGLAASSLFYLLGYFLIPFVLPSDRSELLPLARLCLLLIPVDIFNQILLAVEQGRMRWRRYNISRLSFFLFYLILICLIWTARMAQVRWFVGAFLASQMCTALLRLWMQRNLFAGCTLQFAECPRLVRSGLPYFWATAGNLLTLQIDTILVISLMSVEAAGMYAVASAFGNAQASLGDALGITSFAIVSNEKSAGWQAQFLTGTFRQSTLISAGLGLLLACLIPFLVRPLFGTEFSQAIRPAIILSLAASLTTSSAILNQGLRGAGRPYAGLLSQLSGAGVLMVTAALFLQRFGLIGMAWAVALGACTQVLVLVGVAARCLEISPLCFWPFGLKDVRLFCRQVAALRLRTLRLPA
jgi:O-antigen/teichoic acid export membrane protein